MSTPKLFPAHLAGPYVRAAEKHQKANRNYHRLLLRIRIPERPYRWKCDPEGKVLDVFVFVRSRKHERRVRHWERVSLKWLERMQRPGRVLWEYDQAHKDDA